VPRSSGPRQLIFLLKLVSFGKTGQSVLAGLGHLSGYLFFRLVRIQPFYSTLRRLNRAVIAYPDAPSFCEHFQNIDEAFKKEGRFSHAWAEFGETLVHPEADEQKVIRNTTRPASYLNVHAAIESGLPLPGYQASPLRIFLGRDPWLDIGADCFFIDVD
jgi:hypothetical protein